MIKKCLIAVILLTFCSGLYSYFNIKLKPSMDLFSDNFGWGINLGIENNLQWISKSIPEGLYWGANFYTFGSSVTNLNYYSLNGGLTFGYRLTIGKKILFLSAGMTAGGGTIHLQNVLTNVDTGAFFFYPEISIDFPVSKWFQLGLNAGYRMYFLNLYDSFRMVNSIQAGLGLTFQIN